MIKYGMTFKLADGSTGRITEIFCDGFNYHTLNSSGDCIKGQQYMLKSRFTGEAV